jgi:hypothetical protein
MQPMVISYVTSHCVNCSRKPQGSLHVCSILPLSSAEYAMFQSQGELKARDLKIVGKSIFTRQETEEGESIL